MLIRLIVDNFLSFENETEITMLPSNKTTKKLEHKVKVKSTPLLKYSVIYGANAAGKSNLIEAFDFIKYCVNKAIPIDSSSMFCRTSKENANRVSSFEIQFTVGKRFYSYGFSLLLSTRSIQSEWLYELFQKGSSKMLFEWKYNQTPKVGITLNDFDKARMETYLSDFDKKSDMLFLTTMNRGKRYTTGSKLFFFKEVYDWLNNNLTVCTPQTSLTSFEYYYDEASLLVINELIKTFDTGITEVGITEISIEELRQELPPEIFDDVMEDIRKKAEEGGFKSIRASMRSYNSFFNIEMKKGEDIKISTIKLKHGNSEYNYKFKEESDGTRRLFELLDMLLNKGEYKVYVVDEMERSLHPKLTEQFIKLFDKLHLNQNMQLIFTTHEASIMDQQLFRRDEIWFVERDKNNASHIYSLDKFKERYDKNLSKAYLEGRYGAIPVFGSFSFKEE